jgi:putative spermidine/putrescine transport system ATP-binding protein
MTALAFQSVIKRYGDLTAVDGLELVVQAGSVVSLLGPSGCGKTTTLRLVAGFERPDAGSIAVGDRVVAGPGTFVAPERRRVGMVFQDYALFPHLDVAGNCAYALGRNASSSRVNELLELVGLRDQARRRPHELSGGQQQRVAVARALASGPEAILLDEPFSNLDAGLRAQVRQQLREILARTAVTALFVTHDQEEALSLADRIVVLRDGAVRQVGTPEDLFTRPDHLDVAEFMGFRNRAAGRVVAVEGDRAAVDVNGTRMTGLAREPVRVGEAAVATVRPEDLHPVEGEGLSATVVSTEFRGREFLGLARTQDGVDLSFRSGARLEPGRPITLGANPERVLVYPGGVS